MMSDGPSSAPAPLTEFRIAPGTDLPAIPNLDYMLQLMGSLEAINSAIRWGLHVEDEREAGIVRHLDRIMVRFVCTGWCAEAFRLLTSGKSKGMIDATMLNGKQDLISLWNRIVANQKDEVIRKVHRIRDQYFGHFDPEVMRKFVEWQGKNGAPATFFIGDETVHPLACRFTWPIEACLFDLYGDPANGDFGERVDKLLDSLEEIMGQTGNLLQTILESWVRRSVPIKEVEKD